MKKKIIISSIIVILSFVVLAVMYVFQSHRDVVNTEADYSLKVNELVQEYLDNQDIANEKYLSNDGQSKILAVEGTVISISKSQDGRDIVILKDDVLLAGIQCLFAKNKSSGKITVGDIVLVKGVLRAGPGYDDDLEMFENGYLEKCSIVN